MDNLPQIIGIAGRKYNGKDTLGDILVNKYGYTKLSFAQPIKDISKILFGFNDEQLYGSLKEVVDSRWNVTPRDMFQFIGTEMFRNMMATKIPGLGQGFWIKCFMERVKIMIQQNPNIKIVIPDIRFPNEIDAIRKFNNHLLLRVNRPCVNNNIDVHESEIHIEELSVDHVILNDSDIKNLENALNKHLQDYKLN